MVLLLLVCKSLGLLCLPCPQLLLPLRSWPHPPRFVMGHPAVPLLLLLVCKSLGLLCLLCPQLLLPSRSLPLPLPVMIGHPAVLLLVLRSSPGHKCSRQCTASA